MDRVGVRATVTVVLLVFAAFLLWAGVMFDPLAAGLGGLGTALFAAVAFLDVDKFIGGR